MSKHPICLGSYSPHFKTHPAWKILESVFNANNIIQGIENESRVDEEVSALISASDPRTIVDLEIHLKGPEEDAPSTRAVLVVSPSCLKSTRRAATEAHLKAFINDRYREGAFIAVLCRETPLNHESNARSSLRMLMDLHQLLIPILPKRLPVVAIFDPADFVSAIIEFIKRDTGVVPRLPSTQYVCPFTLLSRHAGIEENVDPAGILGTLFPNMRALSQAIRTEGGKDLMNAFYHQEQTETLERFMLQDSRVD